jgi:hypothetical protein
MQTIDFDLASLSEGAFDALMPTADLMEKKNAKLGQVIRGLLQAEYLRRIENQPSKPVELPAMTEPDLQASLKLVAVCQYQLENLTLDGKPLTDAVAFLRALGDAVAQELEGLELEATSKRLPRQ